MEEQNLIRVWFCLVGEKVIAEYKENIVDKKTVIKYKLELKK
jgi:hypothetical protein